MSYAYTNTSGRVLPKSLYQMHVFSIVTIIVLMILGPGFFVYCALATESTFWGCLGLAFASLVILSLFLTKAIKNIGITKMTFFCDNQCVVNQTAHKTNHIYFEEKVYVREINIPFYIGKGKTEISYWIHTNTEENSSVFEGYCGLTALQQLHEVGAVLVPKEAVARATDEQSKSNEWHW